MALTDPTNKYALHCGATGCPNRPDTECYYCGIPLCSEHARVVGPPELPESYCTGCYQYIHARGLEHEHLTRRLLPKLLHVNSKKCTGCRTCQLVCSFQHFGVFSYEKAALQLQRDEEHGITHILICRQCADPACVSACPTEALHKDKQTGAVCLRNELCTGCLRCIEACPYGALRADESKRVVVCDLCDGNPQCARYCPAGALAWVGKHAVGERRKLVHVEPTSNSEEKHVAAWHTRRD